MGTALALKARAGFRYGDTALASDDPSAIGAAINASVTPVVVEQTYVYNGPEGETATGPNFPRSFTTTITVAPGQTLTDYDVVVALPDNVVFKSVTGGVTQGAAPSTTAPAAGATLTQRFSTLGEGTHTVTVEYWIPEDRAGGSAVLSPVSGAESTAQFQVSSSGNWDPKDPRDDDQVVSFDPADIEVQHAIQSIAVQKSVNKTTTRPGDTLNYTLDFQISDYFSFKDIVITDTVSDGQVVTGTPKLMIYHQGVAILTDVAITPTDSTVAGDDTRRVFDISAALPSGFAGILEGGKFDDNDLGGTYGVITYQTTVQNEFTSPVTPGDPQLNHGDVLTSQATISGEVVQTGGAEGGAVTDDTGTSVPVVSGGVRLVVHQINGVNYTPGQGIKPGDTVTYRLEYDLATGDFENLKLDAYLPLPVFKVWDWDDNIVTPGTWTYDASTANTSPAAGAWKLVGTDVTNHGTADWPDTPSLDVDPTTNGLKFNLGSREDDVNAETKVVILFSAIVADDPFADALYLTAQVQATENDTPHNAITHQAIDQIQLNEPNLTIIHGIVSKTGNGAISGTTGTWGVPGTSNDVPFSAGSPLTSITGIDGNITDIDAGDRVRFAAAIANTGGSGAFDVSTLPIVAPDGFKFVTAAGTDAASVADANLKLYRGDGTLLTLNTDYSINGGIVTLLDSDSTATIAQGRNGGTPVTDGSNIIVITYDAVALTNIAAGLASTSTVAVDSYAGVNEGENFLPVDDKGTPDLSDDVNLVISDTATATVAAPTVKIVFKDGAISDDDSSATHTTGNNLVIGESMIYDIVVTLPEGTTHDLRVDGLVPNGLKLDTTYNGDLGYEFITIKGTGAGQSDALEANFDGTVEVTGVTGVSGTLGNSSVDPRFTLTDNLLIADDGNNASDNNFVIRVRLIADNIIFNQAGGNRDTGTQLIYDDAGDNGADVTVAQTGASARITIREPQLTIVKAVDTNGDNNFDSSEPAVDDNDPIKYRITIGNGNTANDYDAFDLRFEDTFASVLDVDTESLVVTKNGSPIVAADYFEWVGNKLQTKDGVNLDLLKGETLVIEVSAVTRPEVAAVASFDSNAIVHWSSLDSASNATGDRIANERHGDDGTWNQTGILNDYRKQDGALVSVAANYVLSRVGGLADTTVPGDDTTADNQPVAVGEIVRFRAVVQVPEGNISGLVIQPNLASGYTYLGAATVALVSDGGLTSNIVTAPVADTSTGVFDDIESGLNSSNFGSRPIGSAPTQAITIVAAAGGNPAYFDLGNIANLDNDPEAEYIVIEFNALVTNSAGNNGGTELESNFIVKQNGIGGTQLGTDSNTTVDIVAEPNIPSIDKQVFASADGAGAPNQAATDTLTVRTTFIAATGTATSPAAPAYDAVLTDSLTNGSGYTFKSLTADGTTYTTQAAAEAAGYTFTFDDGTGVTVNFNGNAINPGETVTFEYDVTVPTDTVGTPTDATLVWSSLPDGAGTISQTGFAGSSVGTDGTTGGERIWDSATALLNDYRRQDNAGYSTISGNIWDDTRDQNGAKDAGEQALAGVTVTLTTAGADGLWGTSDDVVVATTQTESNGDYIFGALPVGDYRVTAPATLDATITGTPDDTDTLAPRWDADGGTLGSITVTLGTMATTGRNIGYLQENDAPTVTFADTTPRTFVEGVDTLTDRDVLGTPVALGTVTVADVEIANGLDTYENTTLTIARSNGTTGFTANAEDVLGFTGSGDTGINVSGGNLRNGTTVIGTVTNSGGQLVITFNAAADASIVNAVASAITYANSSDTPPADVTLRYRFNDANDNSKQGSGGALTGDAIIQVNITAQNDPPLAIDDTNEVVEDSLVPATGNVITGVSTTVTVPDTVADSDVDNTIDELNLSGIRTGTEIAGGAFTSITAGTNSGTGTQVVGTYGTLTIGADGSYSYELDNDNPDVNALLTGETLEEVFTYRLTDPDGGTDQAQLTITIHGVTDGGNLAIDPVDHNGGAAIGHNTVYEAGLTSAADTSETAAGSIIVSAPEGIATITVEGEDFTVAELQALSTTNPSDPIDTGEGILRITGITVLAGDSSVPTSTQVHYTYTLKDAITNATPAETESTDSISLRVTDNSTSANTADGTLVIQIIDDVPAANPDASSITKGSATVTGNAFTNDRIGADGAATVGSPVTAIAGGTLGTPYNGTYGAITLNANGSYTYTLDNNNTAVQALGHGQTLTETFTYTITDGDGDTSTATVTITIHGDHLPLALNDSFTLNEDTVLTSTLAGNDTPSADGGNLWAKATDPQHGSVVVNPDGTFTYTPAPDYNGPDSFTYTLTDGDGDTSTATVNLTVTPVNDLPVAVDDSVTTGKNTPVGGTLAGNDTPSGDGGNLWTKTTDPANGSVVVNPDGTYAYTPDEGFSGEDSFTYTITDADGDTSTATVTITVSPTDVPLAVDDTVTTPGGTPVSGSLAGNDTPSTDGGNTWTLTDSPTNGTVVVNEDGTFTYTPNEGFVGEDSFTYTITDADGDTSTATVTITVSPTDVPLAVDDTVTTPGGTPVSGNLAGNDTPSTDGGNTWTLTDNPTNGTVAVNEDGTFTYTPDEGFVGEDSFTYTLTDADGDSSTATVTITVNPPVTEPEPVNTPPVAVNDGVFTAPADTPLTNLDVLGNDSDPDGDPLTVTGASVPPGQGTVTINPDGTLDFTPAPDYTGPVEITYTIDDGNGGTATAVVNIEVVTTPTPPSSIPLAVNDHVTTGADTPISSSLAGNDTPSGNGDNTWALEIGPLHGSVVVNADGTFTYMPNARFEGRDSFTYTLTDAVGSVSQATVTIVLVDPVSPYVFSPATGAQPLPPLELWPTNLLQERENHDPSVFFDGGRFDRVIRLPIPMYPITYVNNAVELSQLQRGLTDPLLFSRPERADTLRLERSSANQELGFDPALFVQHQVRESQSLANFLQQIVEGRLTRVSLGSDRLIATPELSAPSPAELIPPTHEKAAKSVEKPDHEHRDTGSTPLLRESAATDGNELLPKAQTRPSAPSFTQQLRSATGRGAKLPASVGGSNGFV